MVVACLYGYPAIAQAKEIQSAPDAIEIQALLEGKVRAGDSTLATLDAGVRCANAEFREGDACNMDAEVSQCTLHCTLMGSDACHPAWCASGVCHNPNLRQELGGPFDAVLMSNLICRVPDPAKVGDGMCMTACMVLRKQSHACPT